MKRGLWQRPTQTQLLVAKLRESRAMRRPLELPEIMRLGIAQHGARFNELRSRGFVIENELDHDSKGSVRSRYWLMYDPECEVVPEQERHAASAQFRTDPPDLGAEEQRDDG